MITKEELDRINELAKEAKLRKLTEEEKEEQEILRNKYIQGIRESFQNQISSLKIIDREGTDITPQKIKDLKDKNN